MKFRGIVLLGDEGHAIKDCCRLLRVSCSGFYDWKRRLPSKRAQRDLKLINKVKIIFNKNKGRYGSPRIQKALENEGEKVSKNKVAKLMREDDLRAKGKKAFRPKTTVNNPLDFKSPRVFKIEDNKIKAENEVWGSDLTYIATKEGFCYLTVVLDLWNREIKGKNISVSMEARNTKDAFLSAVKNSSGRLNKTIFHSDQGVQYCSKEVREKLKFLELTQSMSRKGNCYDNAFVESFFHSLKTELGHKVFENFEEAKKEIFEYIDWYNNERLHSSLGYLSPRDYVKKDNHQAA
jgi:transposase InsO family protein